jgi:hypothetical protein
MKIELNDGRQLEVKAVFGSNRLINGSFRDTFRIEIDPQEESLIELQKLFKNNPNTSRIYSYITNEETGETVKTLMGEGYTIFISVANEMRELPITPGLLAPPVQEDINVVTIAQMTYAEHMSKL